MSARPAVGAYFLTALCLAAAIYAAPPASAANRVIERFAAGGWEGTANLSTRTGTFNHCNVTRSYSSARRLSFGLLADGQSSLIAIDTGWTLGGAAILPVEIVVRGRRVGRYSAIALLGKSIAISFQGDSRKMMDAIARSSSGGSRGGGILEIRTGDRSLRFDLGGAGAAIARARQCFRKHAPGVAMRTDGNVRPIARRAVPGDPQTPQPHGRRTITLSQYQALLARELGKAGVFRPDPRMIRVVRVSPIVLSWPGGANVRGFLARGKLPGRIEPRLGMLSILRSIAIPCGGQVSMDGVSRKKAGDWDVLDGSAQCQVGDVTHTFAFSGYFKDKQVGALGFVGTGSAGATTAKASNRKMRRFLIRTLDPKSKFSPPTFETRKQ